MSLYKDEQGNIRSRKSGSIEKILVDRPFGHSHYIDPPENKPLPEFCSHPKNHARCLIEGKYKLCCLDYCPIFSWMERYSKDSDRCEYAIYGHYENNKFVEGSHPYKRKEA